MLNQALEQSMLATLTYFSLTNHPLTREEWYAWLWCPPPVTYLQFCEYLEKSSTPFWINVMGFYTLPGHENNALIRGEKVLTSTIHLRRARRAAKLLRLLPHVRMVVVGNSVGALMADEKSDIDLLVVAAAGRVWTVRFMSNILLRIFRLRTYGTHRAGRICLSFFVDEKNLNTGNWRAIPDDIYLVYWLCHLIPIYDPTHLFGRLLRMNSWITKYVPNVNLDGGYIHEVKELKIWSSIIKCKEYIWDNTFGDKWEWLVRAWQIKKMKPEIRRLDGNRDKGVILGCGVIKLHDHDARLDKREEWLQTLKDNQIIYETKPNQS